MAVRGISRKAVAYIPERERGETEDQTVIGIRAKDGHGANKTLSNYAATGKDGRGGFRELSTAKLDSADFTQFLDVVEYWHNYYFSDKFPDLAEQGLLTEVTDEATLLKIAQDIDPELMNEIFEVSNDQVKLVAGSKKESASPSTSHSGRASSKTEE